MSTKPARHLQRLIRCTAAAAIGLLPIGGLIAQDLPDERMILAHDLYVLTFDAESVQIDGARRLVRTHMYLPGPDSDGYLSYDFREEIDCVHNLAQYTAASGRRVDGSNNPVMSDTPGLRPIVRDTPSSVVRDHMCALRDVKAGVYGVSLEVPGQEAAAAVFGLLKLGIDAKPAAALASQGYADWDTVKAVLDRNGVPPANYRQVVAALGSLVPVEAQVPAPIVPLDAAVRSGWVGRYVHSEMELVAGLWLKVDGTFEYGLIVGSLDENARGRWVANGDRIDLSQGNSPARRGDLDVSAWKVTPAGDTLTIRRDGQDIVFYKRN